MKDLHTLDKYRLKEDEDLFFEPEDTVVEYHPPKSEYVNNYPYCLHLWRPNDGQEIPMPPLIMV